MFLDEEACDVTTASKISFVLRQKVLWLLLLLGKRHRESFCRHSGVFGQFYRQSSQTNVNRELDGGAHKFQGWFASRKNFGSAWSRLRGLPFSASLLAETDNNFRRSIPFQLLYPDINCLDTMQSFSRCALKSAVRRQVYRSYSTSTSAYAATCENLRVNKARNPFRACG